MDFLSVLGCNSMGNKKKRKKPLAPRSKRMDRKERLDSVTHWLSKYKGKNIIKGYKNHFGVDWLCAIKELQMLGVGLDPGYVEKLKLSVKNRIIEKQRLKDGKKQELENEISWDSDETFAYIAGYTSAGFPYGVTWEELGEEPPNFED
ncbi:MAG: hypothetical protein JRG87_15185 [Deltaproteobacteria bacterium]|nr:hypothetical protein [Deltaproteobacteria bacterium]MBW1970796.1 hypothetical protein [Deltaproteobacteria bacterium]MBW2157965.1 hypothetical protein [Deltaproteobacteria bacterium]